MIRPDGRLVSIQRWMELMASILAKDLESYKGFCARPR
jgi:hypothetical protein